MLAPHTEPTVASVFTARTRIEEDGTVEGYASLFGEIDQARDKVVRGAFADTLRTRSVRRVPMLFQHDPAEPIGIWLDLREDSHGLYARGRLIPEVARARELLSLLRAGAIDGLSIGFRTARARIDPRTRIRSLLAVDLWEISIVTFPLLNGARVHAVKQTALPPPKASYARTRAEREWARVIGGAPTSQLSSPGNRVRPPASPAVNLSRRSRLGGLGRLSVTSDSARRPRVDRE
jgi:HK97 family phage prohead protease